jgi:hypothetical protein
MKARVTVLGALLIAMVLLGGSDTGQYVPTANEELYKTWVNESMTPQKTVNFLGGYKDYALISDTTPSAEGTEQIYSKWTDSDGNVWYKTFGQVTAGNYSGFQFQTLSKISRSGKVREIVVVAPVYGAFDDKKYPTTIHTYDPTYRIYNRAEK